MQATLLVFMNKLIQYARVHLRPLCVIQPCMVTPGFRYFYSTSIVPYSLAVFAGKNFRETSQNLRFRSFRGFNFSLSVIPEPAC